MSVPDVAPWLDGTLRDSSPPGTPVAGSGAQRACCLPRASARRRPASAPSTPIVAEVA